MRTTTIFVLSALSLVVGCQPTYPGGLSQQEWQSLPPEKRAQLQMQQDALDEQRRSNESHEAIENQIATQNQPPPPPAVTQEDPNIINGWAILARADVNFYNDHEVIPIGAAAGAYSTLRFIVRGGDLDVYKCVVVLGNGEKLGFDVRGHYIDNTISGPMEIPGSKRYIDHVELSYRSHGPRPGKTIFVLHGK